METIRNTVIRLGQNEVVNIVMTVIHKGNFNSKVPIIKNNQMRLWNHNFQTLALIFFCFPA